MLDHFKSRTAFEEFQCHRLIHLAMASLSLLNGSLACLKDTPDNEPFDICSVLRFLKWLHLDPIEREWWRACPCKWSRADPAPGTFTIPLRFTLNVQVCQDCSFQASLPTATITRFAARVVSAYELLPSLFDSTKHYLIPLSLES